MKLFYIWNVCIWFWTLFFIHHFFLMRIMLLIWFDLFHTPIWHQSEVGPCGRTIETIKELNEKKILRPSSKIKNLFSRQKQRGVMTSFRHFNTNESYNPCLHKEKKTKWNQKNKINFINVEFLFVSVLFLWSNFEQISHKFVYCVIDVIFSIILSCFDNRHKIEMTIIN